MSKSFIVVSGLPGSGKTTLGRQLASAFGLSFIDKDDILHRLFDAKGAGDAAWRRALSRESDAILQHEATASIGAVLVSLWRVPGMSPDSGTPTDWLSRLSEVIVNVRCVCPPEVASTRFIRRQRHPGHLDEQRSPAEHLTSIEALARLQALQIGQPLDVDTSGEIRADSVVEQVREAFTRCLTRVAAGGAAGDDERRG